MLEELCKEDASVKAPEASSQNSSVPMLALSGSPTPSCPGQQRRNSI